MDTLDFTFIASGAYAATAEGTMRAYSVTRLTSTKWVMDAAYIGGGIIAREEAPTMRQAKVLANARELAEQGRTGEALTLLNTIR